jgi:hypothetical protein
MSDPLRVAFVVEKDDVWIDPDGVAWYVKSTDALNGVHLQRTVTTDVDPRELVRKWRKMGEPA